MYKRQPHPHAWQPEEEDWHLPENWEEIIYKALKERLAKHRSLKIFMDTCVRCGACADKCHFFLGTNDPKNMPVLLSLIHILPGGVGCPIGYGRSRTR